MDTDDLRVTFTNLTSFKTYPDNKITSFRVGLNIPLDLSREQWEVCLYEFAYPKSWYSIEEDSTISFRSTRFKFPKTSSVERIMSKRDTEPINFSLTVPKRYYSSMTELLEELNTRLTREYDSKSDPEENYGFKFTPIRYTNKAREDILQVGNPGDYYPWATTYLKVTSGLGLWKMMGFDNIELGKEYQLPLNGTRNPALTLSVPIIFVYAPDLIEYQFVGDTSAPLLECVPVDFTDTKEVETFHQSRGIYKPVINGYINTIRIEIRDIFGNPIPLKAGQIIITLHFRKCRTRIISGGES